MNSYRRTAAIVGFLFLFAIVTLFVGQSVYNPILDSPQYLETAFPNKTTVMAAMLLEFVGYLGLVLIPVLLYPILEKYNKALALGYVSFRLFEAVLLTMAIINKLSLIDLSQEYLSAGGADASYFEYIGSATKSAISWVNSDGLIYLVVFGIGALLFYSALYQSRLVPRWLSGWGFVGAAIMTAGAVLAAFGTLDLVPESWGLVLELTLVLPLLLNELTLAIWLIVKGFDPSALAPESTKTDSNWIEGAQPGQGRISV